MLSATLVKNFTAAASGDQRLRVLSLYRRIMKMAQNWTSASNDIRQTVEERDYIREEARTLFRKNAHLRDPKEIEAHILEGQSRLDLAMHYKNPYPRLSNLPQYSMPDRSMKRNQRIINDSIPAYLKSYKSDKK